MQFFACIQHTASADCSLKRFKIDNVCWALRPIGNLGLFVGRYWETVQRLKINQFYGAPTAVRLLLKYGDAWVRKYDRSSLRTLGSGERPVPLRERVSCRVRAMQASDSFNHGSYACGCVCGGFKQCQAHGVEAEVLPVSPSQGPTALMGWGTTVQIFSVPEFYALSLL